jgi:uncharacterized protein involved in response to NO
VAAYALVNLAAAVRVITPLAVPEWYFPSLAASGALWCAAFTLFVFVYWPVLTGPRVDRGADGRPG